MFRGTFTEGSEFALQHAIQLAEAGENEYNAISYNTPQHYL
jgi:hypothetical protein